MNNVIVKVVSQGLPVLAEHGYDVSLGEGVVAFFVDAWGETGRAYPVCSSSVLHGNLEVPSICFESGENEEETWTEVCFPQFDGWHVHSISGGKTVAVCLTLEN